MENVFEKLKLLNKRNAQVMLFNVYLYSKDLGVKLWFVSGRDISYMPLMMQFHAINIGLVCDNFVFKQITNLNKIPIALKKLLVPELHKYHPELLTKAAKKLDREDLAAIRLLRAVPEKVNYIDGSYGNFAHPIRGFCNYIDRRGSFDKSLNFANYELATYAAIVRDDVKRFQSAAASDKYDSYIGFAARNRSKEVFKFLTQTPPRYTYDLLENACIGGDEDIIKYASQLDTKKGKLCTLTHIADWMQNTVAKWFMTAYEDPVSIETIAGALESQNWVMFMEYLEVKMLPDFHDPKTVMYNLTRRNDLDSEDSDFEEEEVNQGQELVDCYWFVDQLERSPKEVMRNFMWMIQDDPTMSISTRNVFLSDKMLIKVDDMELMRAIGSGGSFTVSDIINAAKSGSFEALQKFVDIGIVDEPGPDGRTPLMVAIDKNEDMAATILIMLGKLDINAVDKEGMSVLAHAAKQALSTIIELLVKKHADVNALDNSKRTILMHAATGAQAETEHDFLSFKGHPDAISLCSPSASKSVKFLLTKCHNVNAQDNEGKTALMYSVDIDAENVVAPLLLKAGADINATDNSGRTALMFAAMHPYDEVMMGRARTALSILLEWRADVNVADKMGRTALMYALDCCNDEDATLLVAARADVCAVDANQNSTIKYARTREMLALLTKHGAK